MAAGGSSSLQNQGKSAFLIRKEKLISPSKIRLQSARASFQSDSKSKVTVNSKDKNLQNNNLTVKPEPLTEEEDRNLIHTKSISTPIFQVIIILI